MPPPPKPALAPDDLTSLGLDAAAAAAYRALVGVADADLAQLQSATGLDAAVLAAAVTDLLDLGLALDVPSTGAEQRVRATPPSLALGPLLADQRGRLDAAESLIEQLAVTYRSHRTDSPGSPIEVVHGRDLVARRFAQIQLSATELIEAFVPFQSGQAIVPVEDNPAEKEAIRRGIRFEVILERAWFDRDDVGSLVGDAMESGQELSVVERLPMQLVIADRRIAMVPVGSGSGPADGDHGDHRNAEPAAAIIHEPGLVEAFRALFATYREKSRAITTGSTDPVSREATVADEDAPDAVDQSILALLNAGLTDVNIARQIGMAPRSVQRRLQRLMGLAGARSRFQLGSHAVRSGWLAD